MITTTIYESQIECIAFVLFIIDCGVRKERKTYYFCYKFVVNAHLKHKTITNQTHTHCLKNKNDKLCICAEVEMKWCLMSRTDAGVYGSFKCVHITAAARVLRSLLWIFDFIQLSSLPHFAAFFSLFEAANASKQDFSCATSVHNIDIRFPAWILKLASDINEQQQHNFSTNSSFAIFFRYRI